MAVAGITVELVPVNRTCPDCNQAAEPCRVCATATCPGWVHTGLPVTPYRAHYCGGDTTRPLPAYDDKAATQAARGD